MDRSMRIAAQGANGLGLRLKYHWRNWTPVLRVISVLWMVLAIFMAIPWLVLVVERDPDAHAFGLSMLIVLAAVGLVWLSTLRTNIELKPWQMFVLTTLSWV